MKLLTTSPAPAGAAMFRDHRAWYEPPCVPSPPRPYNFGCAGAGTAARPTCRGRCVRSPAPTMTRLGTTASDPAPASQATHCTHHGHLSSEPDDGFDGPLLGAGGCCRARCTSRCRRRASGSRRVWRATMRRLTMPGRRIGTSRRGRAAGRRRTRRTRARCCPGSEQEWL